MFARLTGTVDEIADHTVVVDVHGVGYLVACSGRTLARLESGTAVRLFIDTQVREDAIALYGFIDAEEQRWFRLLTTVQGVGSKVGLSILSSLAPGEIEMAVLAQDKAALSRADGVGPKLATRIVSELKDKVAQSAGIARTGSDRFVGSKRTANDTVQNVDADAVSALVNLGYGRAEAYAAVMKTKQKEGVADMSALIRNSLKELAQG